jgi:hypothetical protein
MWRARGPAAGHPLLILEEPVMRFISIVVFGLPLAGGVAAADPAPPSLAPTSAVALQNEAPPEKTISINIDPGGALMGYYGGNVEWLHGSHGLLVQGSFFHKSSDDSSVSGFGGKVGYRWHWRGRMNSGFLGLNASLDLGSATKTTTDMAGQMTTSDLTVRTVAVTADIGKRWQLDNGINITFAIGAGWANRTVSTSSNDPADKQAAKDIEDLLAFLPIALDGELSLGYSF